MYMSNIKLKKKNILSELLNHSVRKYHFQINILYKITYSVIINNHTPQSNLQFSFLKDDDDE